MTPDYQNFDQGLGKYDGPIRRKDFYPEYLAKIESFGIKSVTELGMGSGDFLWHLPNSVRGIGIDKSIDLVEVAEKTRAKSNLEFHCAEIGKNDTFAKTELVVMTGFLCTFLDYRVPLEAALDISTKHIFINDFLNDFGVDARFSFRERGQQDFQTPYNIWSRETIEGYLSSLGLSWQIVPYAVTSPLLETSNPLFNYRAKLNSEEVLTNRGGILLKGYNLFIRKD